MLQIPFKNSFHNNNGPVWINEKSNYAYSLPDELIDLRIGEKLLIQKPSTYIPLIHVYNGMYGIQCHCVSFPQDVSEVCYKLPHIKCSVVRVIRASSDNQDSVIKSHCKSFMIRRRKVMDALIWLKKFNVLYRDDPNIDIDENNLAWMEDKEESYLHGVHDIIDNANTSEYNSSVAISQTGTSQKHCYFGSVTQTSLTQFNEADIKVVNELRRYVANSKGGSIPTMDFPQIQTYPNNEYDGTPFFAEAYPWMFPGGIGVFFL